jgi:hypothetical protein
LILVSSVLTWNNTPRKLKKNLPKKQVEESDVDETAKSILREDESETEDDPTIPGNKVLYFNDTDF